MKALSIHPLWAGAIWAKEKTVEVRTWKTNYRGDLLICATQQKVKDTIPGHALCVVTLKDCVPFEKKHCKGAMLEPKDFEAEKVKMSNYFAWELENVRYIKPIPLKGKLGLWNYDGEIEYLEEPKSKEEDLKMYHDIFEPLFV